MEITYEGMQAEVERAVRAVESRPHLKFIRYLLSKRVSPAAIRKRLTEFGLSAPSEESLRLYWYAVMLPAAQRHGLMALYRRYLADNGVRQKPHGFGQRLNFKLEVAAHPRLVPGFCRFLRDLEVGDLWVREVIRGLGGHAAASDVLPRDQDGQPLLAYVDSTAYAAVLQSPHRYLVDQCLVEDMSPARIAAFIQDRHGVRLHANQIRAYALAFFDLRRRGYEETLETLNAELKDVQAHLAEAEAGLRDPEEGEVAASELVVTVQALAARRDALARQIRDMSAAHSEDCFRARAIDARTIAEMFEDVVRRGYRRFLDLDRYRGADMAQPLYACVRIMATGFDYMKAAGEPARDGQAGANTVLQLVTKRMEAIMAEQNPEGLTAADVEGMDEGR